MNEFSGPNMTSPYSYTLLFASLIVVVHEQ